MKKFIRVFALLLAIVMMTCTVSSMEASAVSGGEIVNYARNYIGYPYVWGTAGPSTFDCSGFVKFVFSHFGISLPHGTSYIWDNPTSYGTVVGYGNLNAAEPGDLISWQGHIAIYSGNGYDVEALNSDAGVVEIKVDSHEFGYDASNYRVIRVYGVNSTVDLGNDFYAYVEPAAKVIHLENTGSNVQLTAKNDDYEPKQIWHFLRQSDGSYKIVSEYDGKCMDLYDANPASGTNIWTCQDNETNAQRWFIFSNGRGYGIRTACGTSVMDVYNGEFTAGKNIWVYENNGSEAQQFTIYRITYSKPAKPAASTVSVSSLGLPNKTTTLTWTTSPLKDNSLDNRSYTLFLTKDGTAYQTKTGLTGTSINLTLPKGSYTAKIRAINTEYYNYYTDGNTITFTVKDCTHSWGSGVVTTPASCMSTGTRTYTCSNCGATRTETIEKTAHTLTVINQRDATYDAEGYTGDEYCTVCKQTIKQGTVIQKLDKPTDPTPDTPAEPQPENLCKWCGGEHTGFFGGLVGFFHRIFAAIFGARY